MSKSNHTEAQIIEALNQVEAGRSAEEVGRQYEVKGSRQDDNTLLIGNVQGGRINAFDPETGGWLGYLQDVCRKPSKLNVFGPRRLVLKST